MKTKVTIFFLFLSIGLFAQKKYRVVYDYQTEDISYYRMEGNKIVDTLSKPKMNRNSVIELKLKNVNPFAVDVRTSIQEESAIQEGQGLNFSSLLGGLKNFSEDRLDIDIENPSIDSLFVSETSRGEMSTKMEEVNGLIANISAIKNSLKSNLLNPNLDKEQIFKNILEVSISSTDEESRLRSPKENFYLFFADLKKLVKSDTKDIIDDFSNLSKQIESKSNDKNSLTRGAFSTKNYTINKIDNIVQAIDNSKKQTVNSIDELESLYSMLEASSFEKTIDYILEADRVNFELKFVQSDFSNKADIDDNKSTLKVRNIKLFAKGGFKVNTSVALTLNNFGSKSNDFYKKDTLIGSDQNTHFIPNISTMINFYRFAGENFNVGGSFGVSIPISGTDNINGINYLLGPTLFFGSKSRLSLSGGVAYGPVKVLKNGFKVGDTAPDEEISNFTKTVYDFGYYFGLSFSLFNVK